jgi:hypothetical protein
LTIVFLPVLAAVVIRMESEQPKVKIDMPTVFIGMGKEFQIDVEDRKSGIKRYRGVMDKGTWWAFQYPVTQDQYPRPDLIPQTRVKRTILTWRLCRLPLQLGGGPFALMR